MYSLNNNFESDLVNSYAWDTAIVFIEKYSEGNSNYANKKWTEFSSSDVNTGGMGDVVCNIHDMAVSRTEWTTEHSTNTNTSCVIRGGYNAGNHYTAIRDNYGVTSSDPQRSFRSLLYL